ncbi:MAG: Deoxyadenosine kinase / Deoxyguanosine kinase (endogenous virus) [Lactobacillus phage ViSo-2018a]|uniref:Deoxyadenosine kinase / Deoxyguanosine kinase n=1 Tax=Lactobacillus phage ViSo-2018a TaxID=2267607 RepID=A0A3G6JGW8_9CAUD|nr:MAG: Deoxyadenosine kinase / Deoxyguanosine kinase [Lactobacillus phage ViSo-2018a]AZA17325.1 MAG: Deoxyadenosine kinase / Deoxyguanosine kinase [Lactobacillus phage ViSo-2018a]
MIINVVAPFGTGKSSLVSFLSQDINAKPYFETVNDSIILPKYYANGEESRKQLSFALQVEFLNKRFKMLKSANKQELAVLDSDLISDSVCYKVIHDRGETSDAEYKLYLDLLQNMLMSTIDNSNGYYPSLFVYLDIDREKEVENIIKRGREMELDENLIEYYYSINQGFKDWYKGYSQSPVLKIDCTSLDFVNNVNDQNFVLDTIEQKLVDLGLKSQEWFDNIKAKRVFYTVDFFKTDL